MSPKNPSAQNFVPIRDVREGTILLKNGQMCQVLLASSVNFALKSLDEQRAILRQFQTFLNTLDFSLQICVQSRRLNIEPYLDLLRQQETKQDNDLMKIQLREYIEFVRTFTTEVDVMNKSFFVVVPYTPPSIDLKKGLASVFSGKKDDVMNDTQFEEHRTQLEQRVSVVQQGLGSVGVRTIPLKNDELVELYYHVFNPADIAGSAPAHGT